MNTFARRHRASWAAALSASMVFGGTAAASAQTLTGVLPQNPRAAAIALPQKTLNQIAALEAEAEARTPIQKKISSHLLYTAKMHLGQAIAAGVPALTLGITPSIDGKVEVDITAAVTDTLLAQIEAAGGTIGSSFPKYHAIRATLPLNSLETVAGFTSVQFIKPAAYPMLQGADSNLSKHTRVMRTLGQYFRPIGSSHKASSLQARLPGLYNALSGSSINFGFTPGAGTVDSEGDTTHRAIQARSTFHVDGTGVKIGVISDSDDFLESSQASGNLGQVTVLPGQSGRPGTGEGTAMMEIVHDIAPGASIYFACAGSEAQCATNIESLAAQGCQVIVDDVAYGDESPFQDGIVARAVQTVTSQGVLYFSSAANFGNATDSTSSAWQGDFVDSGVTVSGSAGGKVATVATSGGKTITINAITDRSGHGQNPILFWNDPLGRSGNDYNLFIVDPNGNIVGGSTDVQSGTQDPVEFVGGVPDGYYVGILLHSGSARFLHLDLASQNGTLAWSTPGRTRGHATVNAVGAYGVAATPAAIAFSSGAPTGPYPNPFNSGNQVEHFSSDGPSHLFYYTDGSAITPNDLTSTGGLIVQKPDITAADGVTTSLNGGVTGGESFAPFFGTSAAAPHAAALTALLLSYAPGLTQAQVRSLLTGTAIDIMAAGPDRDSGYGIIDAVALLAAVPTQTPTITSFTPTSGGVGTTVTITGTNFTSVTSVKFNGTEAASFSAANATTITATVPTGATTGTVSVTTPKGTATSAASFTIVVSAPTVTSFTPTSGSPSTSVTITGANLTGATAVTFNGTAATTFTVASATTVNATVPDGATTGKIAVTTPSGTGTSAADFTVTGGAPTVSTFQPTSGPVGTSVIIAGTSFKDATEVKFNNVSATAFTINSDQFITATVPSGATTGKITVTSSGGTGTSSTDFIVTAAAKSITLNPASVVGGHPSTGTLTIGEPAPSGGLTVALSSNNTAATVTSCTVAEGSTSGTFIVNTAPVDASLNIVIKATGTTISATLTVKPPSVVDLQFSPSTVTGGTSTTANVTLNGQAPNGTTLTLTSSTASAQVPINVSIPAGVTTCLVSIPTSSVAVKTAATITASYNGKVSRTLTLTPPSVTSVELSPASVTGGESSTATVTIDTAAPAGGIKVAMKSASTAAIPSATLTVQAGKTTGTATISTIPVATSTTTAITASLAGSNSSATANLTIVPPVVTAISLAPMSVTGGSKSTGTLTLGSTAPAAGLIIPLSSSDPAATVTSCSVAGNAKTGTFTVNTTPVGTATAANISATGTSIETMLTITPPTAAGITLSPTSVTGGSTSTGTLTLGSAAPSTGITFQLSSSDPAATVSTCIVSGGKTTGTFTVTTVPVAAQTAAKITVSGTAAGATLTIIPPVVTAIKLNPTSVLGSKSAAGSVTLNAAAPSGGLTIAMAANDASAKVTVATVAGGAKTGTFTITTIPVLKETTVTITTAESTASAKLTITAPAAVSIKINPAAVIGGSPSTGTLTLSGPAPSAGMTIALSSSKTAAAVTSCKVAGGATSGTFAISTVPVGVVTSVNISVTGTAVGGTLTVNPPLFKSITINPTTVTGGEKSTGTLTLQSPAPASGWTVAIGSNNTAVTAASCAIAGGKTTGTFTIATKPVAIATTVFLKAGTSTIGANITVKPPVVTGLTLSPTTVLGGSKSTGTLTIGSPAPASGYTITFTSSKAMASAAACTIPGGAKTGTFVVNTKPVAALTSVAITAKGTTIGATLSIKPPVAAGVTIVPASVIGGVSARGTVTLGSPAPAGFTLLLVSSKPAAKPAACVFTDGALTGTFTITTTPVAISTPATITVKGTTIASTLTIVPPSAKSIALSPVTVTGGTASTGTLTLTGAAPTAGTTIALASNNAAARVVSCTVPAGSTTAKFTVSTVPVAAITAVKISVKGTSISAPLTINPPAFKSITLSPAALIGGEKSTGTLTLASPAPAAGWTVPIASNNGVASPAACVIAGGKTTGTFTIATKPVAVVTTISIKAGSSTTGATLTVNPPKVTAIVLNPTSVTGGSKTTGTLTIGSAAPSSGYTITFVSSSGAASAAACTIPGGAKTGTFSVTTLPVATLTTVKITAKGTAISASLTIKAPVATKVTITPTTVIGGVGAKGTVTLGSAAPTSGFTLILVSSQAAAKPATCTVPAGATSGAFTITTNPVAVSTAATITVKGTTIGASLTITPATIQSMTLTPATVYGGTTSTGKITLTGAAPTGGMTITLASSKPAAIVTSCVIAAGNVSGTFTVKTVPVAALTSAAITAKGTAINSTLSIKPPSIISLAISPATVAGGSDATGTATLNAPAPAGTSLTLSSDSTAVRIPAKISVTAGATTVTFPIKTTAVSALTTATITATYNGTVTRTMKITGP